MRTFVAAIALLVACGSDDDGGAVDAGDDLDAAASACSPLAEAYQSIGTDAAQALRFDKLDEPGASVWSIGGNLNESPQVLMILDAVDGEGPFTEAAVGPGVYDLADEGQICGVCSEVLYLSGGQLVKSLRAVAGTVTYEELEPAVGGVVSGRATDLVWREVENGVEVEDGCEITVGFMVFDKVFAEGETAATSLIDRRAAQLRARLDPRL